MRHMKLPALGVVLSGLLVFAAGFPVLAQSALDPDVIKAQTGDWLVAAHDGKPGCVLSLKNEETIGGYTVENADKCAKTLPSISEVSAWNFDGDGGVILLDPLRKVKARFVSNEGSALTETDENSEHLSMVPAIPGVDHFPSVMEVKGKWLIKDASGVAKCIITLDDVMDEDENYGLALEKNCPADVKKLKLSTWIIDGSNLLFLGREGTSMSFNITANGFEKNKDEGGKPMLLTRP